MYTGDPFLRDLLQIAPLAIGLVGFLVGFYWIYRITKDIEDN
jgi:hypothetical protein